MQELEIYITSVFIDANADANEALIEKLVDNGIETVEQYTDSFVNLCDSLGSSSAQAQFAEKIICDDLENDLPEVLTKHIDYQLIWDDELSNDYFSIEYNNTTSLFFSKVTS